MFGNGCKGHTAQHRRIPTVPSGVGMAVGDRLATPDPAGAARGALGAARARCRDLSAPGYPVRTAKAAKTPLWRLRRTRAAAAAAATAVAATPRTRADGPPPSARSVMRIVVSVATEQATQGVSRAIGRGGWGACASCGGGCAPPRRPKSCPPSPLTRVARGAAAPTANNELPAALTACERPAADSMLQAHSTSPEEPGGWLHARRLRRARTFIASSKGLKRSSRRARATPRRNICSAGAGCTTSASAA